MHHIKISLLLILSLNTKFSHSQKFSLMNLTKTVICLLFKNFKILFQSLNRLILIIDRTSEISINYKIFSLAHVTQRFVLKKTKEELEMEK